MLLIDRLDPGTLLSRLTDGDYASEFASEVMQAFQRSLPGSYNFIVLRRWFDELTNLRPVQ
jgi:hypothetical protein